MPKFVLLSCFLYAAFTQAAGQDDVGDIIVGAGCVVLMQHKIAVAYWSLPVLLPFVANEIKTVAATPDWWRAPFSARRMHQATRAMLLVVADNATASTPRKTASLLNFHF